MAVPVAYTDIEIASYMLDTIGEKTTKLLGWESVSDIPEAVNDTLLAYGVDTIAEATDIPRLRLLARLSIWDAVVSASAWMHTYSTDGQAASLQQVHDHAVTQSAKARRDAVRAGYLTTGYALTTVPVTYTDIFSHLDETEV